MSDDALFLTLPETGEQEDRLADAAFAQFDSFGRAGDAQPVGAGPRQSLRNRNSTMTIGVGFHHRQNLGLGSRTGSPSLRCKVALDGTQVVRQRAQSNLGP